MPQKVCSEHAWSLVKQKNPSVGCTDQNKEELLPTIIGRKVLLDPWTTEFEPQIYQQVYVSHFDNIIKITLPDLVICIKT